MTQRKYILLVDNDKLNRVALRHMLSTYQDILEAEDCNEALRLLLLYKSHIAVMLVHTPNYDFIEEIRSHREFANLPIMVLGYTDDKAAELHAIQLGATDFLSKSFQPEVFRQHFSNLITLSEVVTLRRATEQDSLTGLYTKETFYKLVAEKLNRDSARVYCIATLNIDHFKLINDLFGIAQADKLLCYVAEHLTFTLSDTDAICARLVADRFAICAPQDSTLEKKLTYLARTCLMSYPLDMKIALRLGLYTVEDISVPINVMCDRALLAGASIKGMFKQVSVHYNEKHRRALLEEQAIVNSMHDALERKEFQIYFHPKYDLHTMQPIGAEVLVRWHHPQMGFISPERFIPLFEKNGFISTMDEYVWEQACLQLRTWLNAGVPALPLSVNVSRVDIYNPYLCAILLRLIHKYSLSPHMLRLEITESAYIDNPEQLNNTIKALRSAGFSVDMDDFGSGYSSLNMLKDIHMDMIKIDLHFLENSQKNPRGACILASVIRMAQRLHLPVLVEGVENASQVAFLRSIGCTYCQGTFFGYAMPAQEFEALLLSSPTKYSHTRLPKPSIDLNVFWQANDEFSLLFNNIPGMICLCELHDDKLEMLRANEQYMKTFSAKNTSISTGSSMLEMVVNADKARLLHCLHTAHKTQQAQTIQYRRLLPAGGIMWLNVSVRSLPSDDEYLLFSFIMRDITPIKKRERHLHQQEEDLLRLFARPGRSLHRLPRAIHWRNIASRSQKIC